MCFYAVYQPGADTGFCARAGTLGGGGGVGVPLQTSKGVWESAVSTITPHPETLATRFCICTFGKYKNMYSCNTHTTD